MEIKQGQPRFKVLGGKNRKLKKILPNLPKDFSFVAIQAQTKKISKFRITKNGEISRKKVSDLNKESTFKN